MKTQLEEVSAPQIGQPTKCQRPLPVRFCVTAFMLAAFCFSICVQPAVGQVTLYLINLDGPNPKLDESIAPGKFNERGETVFWVEFRANTKEERKVEFPNLPGGVEIEQEEGNLNKRYPENALTFQSFITLKFTIRKMEENGLTINYQVSSEQHPDKKISNTLTFNKALTRNERDNARVDELAAKKAQEIFRSENEGLIKDRAQAGWFVWGTVFIFMIGLILWAFVVVSEWLKRREKGEKNTDSSLLHVGDLQDPVALADKLREGKDPLSRYIYIKLAQKTRDGLERCKGSKALPKQFHEDLIDDLNLMLKQSSPLFGQFLVERLVLSEETQRLLNKRRKSNEDFIRLNRMLLAEAYPAEIGMGQNTPEDQDGKLGEKLFEAFEVLIGKLEKEPPELRERIKRLLPAPDVKEALKNPPVEFFEQINKNLEYTPFSDEDADRLVQAVFEQPLASRNGLSLKSVISNLNDVITRLENIGKRGDEREKDDEQPGGGATGRSVIRRTVDEGTISESLVRLGESSPNLLEAERNQLSVLINKLDEQIRKVEGYKPQLEDLKDEISSLIIDLRFKFMEQPKETQPSSIQRKALTGDTTPTPPIVEDVRLLEDDSPGLRSEPQTDPDLSPLKKEEIQKIERRLKATESYIRGLSSVNSASAANCEDYLVKGRDMDKSFVQWLRNEKYEESVMRDKSEERLKYFKQNVVKPIVEVSGIELKENRGGALEESFKEFLDSVGLKHSWPGEKETYNAEIHDDKGTPDNFTKFVNTEGHLVVAEVLSPCVFFDENDVLVKAKVKTT